MKNKLLEIKCKKCKKQLTEQGALIFTPPETLDKVYRFHLCIWCYFELMDWLMPTENMLVIHNSADGRERNEKMGKNPDAKFSMINIGLKNGSNYGCSSVNSSVLPGSIPAITFISSGYPSTIPIEEIKEISISVDNWCPRCE